VDLCYKKEILYYEGTGTGCPKKLWMPCPWKCARPGRMGLFEQRGLVEGVPACGRGVGTRWSLRSFPVQTVL